MKSAAGEQAIHNNGHSVTGKVIRIVRMVDEWHVDVDQPLEIIGRLKANKVKADIFSFWQRPPDTEPRFDFHCESDSIAVLKIESYDRWWKNQINAKTRNLVRKATKKGVELKTVALDDELVRGIAGIFNETPIRQGKPFWHYGKSTKVVMGEMADRLDISEFVGAYYRGDLIGFIKLIYETDYVMMVEILSRIGQRNLAPNNALVAKAVERTAARDYRYLVYAKWVEGSLGRFKINNGFEKVDLPRYYVPMSLKGKIVLKLNMHKGLKSLLPPPLMQRLKTVRKRLYDLKSRAGAAAVARALKF